MGRNCVSPSFTNGGHSSQSRDLGRSAKRHLAGAECVVLETATYTAELKLRNIMNRFSLFALAALVAFGCERADFRNGYSPGELEVIGDAKVYHLTDGVMIEERRNGSKVYYLIESTVADYELTAEGLNIRLEGEMAGTYSTPPAPEGYVAAWITLVPADGPGVTRFQVDEATLAELIQKFAAAVTVRDVYSLKK